MAALTGEQKVFVVERLAAFQTPAEVIQAVAETFGVTVAKQQLQRYDPTTTNGAGLSAELREVFARTRESYIKETAAIPIAHQAFRLNELQRMYRAVGRNAELGAKLLEQAAKEVGGHYTNRRELTGEGGGAVEVDFTVGWSVTEMEAYALAGRLGLEALRRGQDPRELVAADLAREKARSAG